MSTQPATPIARPTHETPAMVSVVIPVYNEEAAIAHDLEVIFATMDGSGYPYEVLVVDDGSTDASAGIVARFPRAEVIRHESNRGVGAARPTGLQSARGSIIVTTDGDGTYPNHDIPRLLALLKECDMAVGARTREAGTWPWLRGFVKGGIQWLASYLTGRAIPDLNSGLRCFRKEIAEQFIPYYPQGHSWESTITLCYMTSNYRVAFLPIEYYQRRGGRSSFHPLRDTLVYIRLVIKTVLYFDPLKFFVPVSVGTILVGIAALLLGQSIGLVTMGLGVLAAVLGFVANARVKRRPRRSSTLTGTPNASRNLTA